MRPGDFETRYRADPDPWDYQDSDYERRKYAATLAACGDGPFGRALELGGSIGVFSALLAPRCERLLTIDVAPTAIRPGARTPRRLSSGGRDRGRDPGGHPRGPYDLIVASEILYYLSDDELAGTFAMFERELLTGGSVVAVHWRPAGTERTRDAAQAHAELARLLVPVADRLREHWRLPARGVPPMTGAFELVILGGGPAGLSAARGYRAAGGTGPVAIVTDEHRMPYRRPPLTKDLLRGESTEAELPLEDETWLGAHAVDLISGRAATLDADARCVTLSGGRRLEYRRCVIATGAEPTRLDVPGADDPAVRVVRALDHVRELQRRLNGDEAVVVIGSGFIGCEIASSLRIRGHPREPGVRRAPAERRSPGRGGGRVDRRVARAIRAWTCTWRARCSGSSGPETSSRSSPTGRASGAASW